MNDGQGRRGGNRGKIRDPEFAISEAKVKINNIARIATVDQVDYEAGKARCLIEGIDDTEQILTDWLPWLVLRAGHTRKWSAPDKGEQVLIVSPSGDLANGVITFSINKTEFRHEAKDSDYEKEVWTHLENDTDTAETIDAFCEYNRRSGIRRNWSKAAGAYRWEVADTASFCIYADSIQARVGTTQLVVQDGKISLCINGRVTELKMDANGITMNASDTGQARVTSTAVSASVTDKTGNKGVLEILSALVEASVNANGVLSVRANSISAKLEDAKVRIGLFETQIKAWVQNTWLLLTKSLAELRTPGSRVTVETADVTIQSTTITQTNTAALGAVYENGSVAQVVPSIPKVAPFTLVAPPTPATGNAPYYPTTQDLKDGKDGITGQDSAAAQDNVGNIA